MSKYTCSGNCTICDIMWDKYKKDGRVRGAKEITVYVWICCDVCNKLRRIFGRYMWIIIEPSANHFFFFFFLWMAAENLNFHGYILLWSISGIFVNSCFANTSGISQIFCFAMKYINFISDCILFKCRLVINKLH